jgi:hypothetical protein
MAMCSKAVPTHQPNASVQAVALRRGTPGRHIYFWYGVHDECAGRPLYCGVRDAAADAGRAGSDAGADKVWWSEASKPTRRPISSALFSRGWYALVPVVA